MALKCPLGNRSPGSHARSHSVIWLRTGFTQINTINRRVKAIYFFIYLLVGIIAVITIAWLASLALALEPTDQRIGVSKTKRPMMASNPFLAVTKFYFQLLRASKYDTLFSGGFLEAASRTTTLEYVTAHTPGCECRLRSAECSAIWPVSWL